MAKFDYSAPAELFLTAHRKIARRNRYRRFDRAAEAIRFAVEDVPEPVIRGAFMQVDDRRHGHDAIRALYDSADYPLKRSIGAR
jgi:hypothetical protein